MNRGSEISQKTKLFFILNLSAVHALVQIVSKITAHQVAKLSTEELFWEKNTTLQFGFGSAHLYQTASGKKCMGLKKLNSAGKWELLHVEDGVLKEVQ